LRSAPRRGLAIWGLKPRGFRRWWHHDPFPAIDLHRIPWGEVATPPGFDRPIHLYITPLDPLLGLTARGGQAMPFEVLIEFHGRPLPIPSSWHTSGWA
jgi:hypothetical protein